VANRRTSIQELKEVDSIVERLRDFLRLNDMTRADVARRIGVRDMTVYSWLQGESQPSKPERITAFLKSKPADKSGFAPTGYEYCEYKTWRGIPLATPLPVLQASQGGDSKSSRRLSGSVSELPRYRAEAGEL
jgi:DNA-binding XRE family transcriptional regulator